VFVGSVRLGVGVLFLLCVCVSGVLFSVGMCVCVCVCDLLSFLQERGWGGAWRQMRRWPLHGIVFTNIVWYTLQ